SLAPAPRHGDAGRGGGLPDHRLGLGWRLDWVDPRLHALLGHRALAPTRRHPSVRVTRWTSEAAKRGTAGQSSDAPSRRRSWSVSRAVKGNVNAPDWIPARSSATKRNPAAATPRRTASRSGGATARRRSAGG